MKVWPERFKEIANIEQKFREITGGDTTILRTTRQGKKIKLPLNKLSDEYIKKEIELVWEQTTLCECLF